MLARRVKEDKLEGNPKGRYVYGVIVRDKMYAIKANSPKEAAKFIHCEKDANIVHVALFDKIITVMWAEA